ncbi:hypothetical protein AC578_4708 [Pseudocercospora eumusae]|uniref:Uncharacterized protein n=1 Tax=Pseudocercospora eumusae TaxID=321146 RepID=A0A139GZ39_9PEZI|nr:hypothetical protein AC578_4708 [Pseudocercospora eumusae]
MVWNWQKHGAVNDERLQEIILQIDKVVTDITEAERRILLKPIREELSRLAYELELENAGFAELVKMSMATWTEQQSSPSRPRVSKNVIFATPSKPQDLIIPAQNRGRTVKHPPPSARLLSPRRSA